MDGHGRARVDRIVFTQILTLAAFLFSLAVNGAYMAWHFSAASLLALVAGWFMADCVSGLVHMYMDYRRCPEGKQLDELFFYPGSRESDEYRSLFRARMAAIGPFERLVYDFKNHHPRPMALGRRSLWRLIGSTVIVAALPVSLLLNLAIVLGAVAPWFVAFTTSLLIGGAFAQYFHGTLHRSANPWFIDGMRRLGILMTPAAHQIHHDTLQRDFATNCGWSNPLLNPLFRTLRARGYFSDAGLVPNS